MNNIFLLLLIILSSTCYAQNTDFTIGLILPNQNGKINENHIAKLESKLSNLIDKSGVVTYGYNNDFVIFPIINIDDINVIQGGLENIIIITIDLTLNIKQISSRKYFNIISKKIKGSGKTEQLAITNAFTSIKNTDNDLVNFIKKGKENIYEYFNENCSNIMIKAANLYTKQDYVQAISLLQSIPETGNNCYSEAQNNAITYYKGYQSKICKENIAKAKSEIAAKSYQNAVELLNMVDSNSNCYSDAQKLINQISDKTKNTDAPEANTEFTIISLIAEITKMYYENFVEKSEYNSIIK